MVPRLALRTTSSGLGASKSNDESELRSPGISNNLSGSVVT
jgi:hypothetical protein